MFLKNIVYLCISCVLGFGLSRVLNGFGIQSENSGYGIGFIALLCLILNTVYILNRKSKNFSQVLIVGISMKLLVCFFTVFLYSFLNHGDFFPFAIHFVANYFLFTIFEVAYLMQLIKNNSTNTASHEK